jgi:outer membrane lipoprotein carrier protein
MRRLEGTIIFLAFVIFFSVSPGYGAELKEVIAALEEGYNSLTDVQADFSQRTVIASIKREEMGSGELFIKKRGGNSSMFRFDYTKPRQQIISDGKSAWYYLPDNRQVMVSDVSALFAGGNGIALNYLTGMGHISRDFTIVFAGDGRDKKGNYVLDLVPKKPNQVLDKLRLTVSAAAVERYQEGGSSRTVFPVVSSVVDDHFGNRTYLELSRVRVNQGMGNDRFKFKIPKGVEVIKNR